MILTTTHCGEFPEVFSNCTNETKAALLKNSFHLAIGYVTTEIRQLTNTNWRNELIDSTHLLRHVNAALFHLSPWKPCKTQLFSHLRSSLVKVCIFITLFFVLSILITLRLVRSVKQNTSSQYRTITKKWAVESLEYARFDDDNASDYEPDIKSQLAPFRQHLENLTKFIQKMTHTDRITNKSATTSSLAYILTAETLSKNEFLGKPKVL